MWCWLGWVARTWCRYRVASYFWCSARSEYLARSYRGARAYLGFGGVTHLLFAVSRVFAPCIGAHVGVAVGMIALGTAMGRR